MVHYTKLIPNKKYKLGDIIIGKFKEKKREPDGDIVLIFLDSEYGEKGENTIYPDEDDDFEEIERNLGGVKRRWYKKTNTNTNTTTTKKKTNTNTTTIKKKTNTNTTKKKTNTNTTKKKTNTNTKTKKP